MGHDHSHDDPKAYYVEQLCTIGIAGALGGIAVMLYQRQLLWFLADKMRPWVLAGGLALLALVAVRAVVVWLQAGRTPVPDHDHAHDHDHDHEHGHDHAHDHGHEHCHDHAHSGSCDHDHDHDHEHAHSHDEGDGHSHGWAPWRYVILLLPVVLYFLDLPNEAMAHANGSDALKLGSVTAEYLADKGKGQVTEVSFPNLQRAPATPESRASYEGQTIRVKGEYLPGNERMFTLVRYRMNCCARDAVPLRAVILVDSKSGDTLPEAALRGKWVEVTGQCQFQKRPDQADDWVTIIVLRPDAEHPLFDSTGKDDKALLRISKPDANYYLN
jgi:hypothetical protein